MTVFKCTVLLPKLTQRKTYCNDGFKQIKKKKKKKDANLSLWQTTNATISFFYCRYKNSVLNFIFTKRHPEQFTASTLSL